MGKLQTVILLETYNNSCVNNPKEHRGSVIRVTSKKESWEIHQKQMILANVHKHELKIFQSKNNCSVLLGLEN